MNQIKSILSQQILPILFINIKKILMKFQKIRKISKKKKNKINMINNLREFKNQEKIIITQLQSFKNYWQNIRINKMKIKKKNMSTKNQIFIHQDWCY